MGVIGYGVSGFMSASGGVGEFAIDSILGLAKHLLYSNPKAVVTNYPPARADAWKEEAIE